VERVWEAASVGSPSGSDESRPTSLERSSRSVLRRFRVVVEYIRYTVPAEEAAALEDAYAVAATILTADDHCLRFEVGRGIEHPSRYVVRIEWDSVEGHEEGFRRSPRFPDFFGAVKPFYDNIEEMTHYELKAGN
jgi:quinol monooxygenase YgiN